MDKGVISLELDQRQIKAVLDSYIKERDELETQLKEIQKKLHHVKQQIYDITDNPEVKEKFINTFKKSNAKRIDEVLRAYPPYQTLGFIVDRILEQEPHLKRKVITSSVSALLSLGAGTKYRRTVNNKAKRCWGLIDK